MSPGSRRSPRLGVNVDFSSSDDEPPSPASPLTPKGASASRWSRGGGGGGGGAGAGGRRGWRRWLPRLPRFNRKGSLAERAVTRYTLWTARRPRLHMITVACVVLSLSALCFLPAPGRVIDGLRGDPREAAMAVAGTPVARKRGVLNETETET